jgi:hypothetical protein
MILTAPGTTFQSDTISVSADLNHVFAERKKISSLILLVFLELLSSLILLIPRPVMIASLSQENHAKNTFENLRKHFNKANIKT